MAEAVVMAEVEVRVEVVASRSRLTVGTQKPVIFGRESRKKQVFSKKRAVNGYYAKSASVVVAKVTAKVTAKAVAETEVVVMAEAEVRVEVVAEDMAKAVAEAAVVVMAEVEVVAKVVTKVVANVALRAGQGRQTAEINFACHAVPYTLCR